MNLADLFQVAPILCVLGAGIAAVGADLWLQGRRRGALAIVSFAGVACAVALYMQRILGTTGTSDIGFSGALVTDDLGAFMSVAIGAATLMLLVASPIDILRRKIPFGEFYGLLLSAVAGMMLLVQANDFVMVFLTLETLSIAMYVLTGITRRNPRSNEAAIKYLVTGGFSTGFLLMGMAFIYGATGSLQLDEIGVGIARLVASGGDDLAFVTVGVVMLLVGFGFKVGAVPFHMWVPDVYEGAPTSVTAFMSVAVKMASGAALVRILLTSLWAVPGDWADLLFAMALLTMIVGNVLALQQKSVKRMLAYSSVAHTGYVLVALAALQSPYGRMSTDGASAAIFYLFTYTFMTLGAFMFLAYMGHEVNLPNKAPEWQDADSFDDLAGLADRRPIAAMMMTLFMVSLGGLPPTAGFFGKLFLFKAVVAQGHYGLAIVGVLMSVVSMYYYLRVVVQMYMMPTVSTDEKPHVSLSVVVGVAALAVILVGLRPDPFLQLAERSVAVIARVAHIGGS